MLRRTTCIIPKLLLVDVLLLIPFISVLNGHWTPIVGPTDPL